MKGDSSCHIPNDKYRDGWDRVFGGKADDVRHEKSQTGNKRDLQEKNTVKSNNSILAAK